jgi:N utilization substance protein B
MTRREARRHAFILIFQIPFHNGYDAETLAEAYFGYLSSLDEEDTESHVSAEDLLKLDAVKNDETDYLIRVTSSVLDNLPELDRIITDHLRGWRLERINRADLAALRLGAYEMLYEPEIPAGAAINEAVELAKKYGTDESASFVNGVLGRLAREQDRHD